MKKNYTLLLLTPLLFSCSSLLSSQVVKSGLNISVPKCSWEQEKKSPPSPFAPNDVLEVQRIFVEGLLKMVSDRENKKR